jgi:anti-anti-sigma factor
MSDAIQEETKIERITGRLDATTCSEIELRLVSLIDSGVRDLVLDFHQLDYISSAGLRALLIAAKRMQQEKGRIRVLSPSDQVRQVFDMAGFSGIIPICDSLPESPETSSVQAQTHHAVEGEVEPLSLAEEIYLLCLDESHGLVKISAAAVLDYVLAGAVLMELALAGRIDTDLETLKMVSADPLGDLLLDEILSDIACADRVETTSWWLKHLADQSNNTEKRVLKRLVQKGYVKQVDRKVLWVFPATRYPLINKEEVKEVRTRLRELVLGDEIPSPHDAVLVSLGNAARVLQDLFGADEIPRVRERIEAISRLDLIGQAMISTIREIERTMLLLQPSMMY